MGSQGFSEVIYTTDSLRDAYRSLVLDAKAMHGNNPYNGTISTTEGVQLHNTNGPVLFQEAQRIADQRMEHLSKWENAEAIQLIDESKFPVRKQTKKVKITAQEIKDNGGDPTQALLAVARANASLRANEVVTSAEIAYEPGTSTRSITPKYRVVTKATEGKTETRYLITNSHTTTPWDKGFKTMAEARKRMVEIASVAPISTWSLPAETEYSITSMTKREGGLPLVRTVREIVSIEATVDFKFMKVTPNAPAAGFYIYGWAAS